MGDKGLVMAIRPHHSSRGQCSCGWVGKPRLLLSAAKCDALMHAAQYDCQPAIPLGATGARQRPPSVGRARGRMPGWLRRHFSVPVVLTDTPSVSSQRPVHR